MVSVNKILWISTLATSFLFNFSLVPFFGGEVAGELFKIFLAIEIGRAIFDTQWLGSLSKCISEGRSFNILIVGFEFIFGFCSAVLCSFLFVDLDYLVNVSAISLPFIILFEFFFIYARSLIFGLYRSLGDSSFYGFDFFTQIFRRIFLFLFLLGHLSFAVGVVVIYCFFAVKRSYNFINLEAGDFSSVFVEFLLSLPSAIFTVPVKFFDQLFASIFLEDIFVFYRLMKSVLSSFIQLLDFLNFGLFRSALSEGVFVRRSYSSFVLFSVSVFAMSILLVYAHFFELFYDFKILVFSIVCFTIFALFGLNWSLLNAIDRKIFLRLRFLVGFSTSVGFIFLYVFSYFYALLYFCIFSWLSLPCLLAFFYLRRSRSRL